MTPRIRFKQIFALRNFTAYAAERTGFGRTVATAVVNGKLDKISTERSLKMGRLIYLTNPFRKILQAALEDHDPYVVTPHRTARQKGSIAVKPETQVLVIEAYENGKIVASKELEINHNL